MSWNGQGPSVCVVGAGAVGGLIGGGLAQGGADVTLVDQGDDLAALRDRGLTLVTPDGEREAIDGVVLSDDTSGLGTRDLVVLGVKAYDLPAVAPLVPP